MAKLGSSSSCRPSLLQGMVLLLALLLLASIQAGPVMASWEELGLEMVEKGAEKARDQALNKVATEVAQKKPGWKDGIYGMKKGYKSYKYGSKAHDEMDKLQNNPGGGSGTPNFVDTIATGGLSLEVVTADITSTAVVAKSIGFCATAVAVAGGAQLISLRGKPPGSVVLGTLPRGTFKYCPAVLGSGGPAPVVLGLGWGGDLARSFRIFSYYVVTIQGTVNIAVVWFPQPPQVPAAGTTGGATTPLFRSNSNDGRYYVQISAIRVVGQKNLTVPTRGPAYLSTTQPFTYLESGLYDNLKAAVIRQTNALNAPVAPLSLIEDKLCYAAAVPPKLPYIAILLASNNVMQTMELGGASVWYQESSSAFCWGFRRATMEEPPVLVLGSMIQRGRTMTIDLTAAAGRGTLTF